MPDVESLAYSPLDMVQFLDFVVNGIKDENGNFKRDEDDREITGVIAWLHGREVPEAHFFASAPDDPVQLFVSVIQPTEDEVVPWMDRVPGFRHMVRVDGKIGDASSFAAASVPGNPLSFVVHRPDLDAIFNQTKEAIAKINLEEAGIKKPELLRTLMGKRGTNLNALLSRVKDTQNLDILAARAGFM